MTRTSSAVTGAVRVVRGVILPDRRSGRWLRAIAIAAFVACGIASWARGEHAPAAARASTSAFATTAR